LIICCGEALIDMVPVLSDSGQTSYAPLVGGAIFNTAIGLGRLGIEVGMVSGVSHDLFGQQLHDALAASKVNTSYLVRSNLPTTLAFVSLDGGHASYTFYDENSAGRCLQITDLPDLSDAQRNNQSNSQSNNALYFGGISLINEPAADAYCALAQKYADDMVIVLDPNIRTSFISNDQAYRQRLQHIIEVADIIKVSDEDLDWLVGDAAAEPQQVGLLRGQRKAIVIVTKGADGATAYLTTGEAVHQNVPKVSVVDTVGAGDTFNAGLLAKLVNLNLMSKSALANISSTELLTALAYAAQVAAVNVSRQGANPPWLSDLQV
jgi:fructokinase